MIDRIVIALDGSHRAELAVPYAAYIGAMLQAKMELVTVTEKPDQRMVDLDQSVQRSLAESEGFMSTWFRSIDTAIISGDPASAITEYAGNSSTMIAMATHGRTGLMRRIAGSVAEGVLRRTDSPLLMIRADDNSANIRVPARIANVLVPLDLTEVAEEALPFSTLAAQKLNSRVTLLHVGGIEESAEYIAKIAEQFDGHKPGLHKEARSGDAGEEIIKMARTLPNCLIVMCSKRANEKTGPIRGSVTDYVLRHTPGPIAVIPYSGD